MQKRAYTLVETLVVLVVLGVILSVGVQAFTSIFSASTFSTAYPSVQQDAVDVVRKLAEQLRGATLCITGDSGCTANAALEMPSPGALGTDGITIYRRTGSLTKVTYRWNTSGYGIFTKDGTTLFTDVNASVTYYTSSTGYNSDTPTKLNGAPQPADLPNLIAIGITATVSRNGVAGTYTTLVRLRNSPYKPLTG